MTLVFHGGKYQNIERVLRYVRYLIRPEFFLLVDFRFRVGDEKTHKNSS